MNRQYLTSRSDANADIDRSQCETIIAVQMIA